MALMVFVTENCRKNARDHGLVNELDAFRDRVEQTQSTSLFDPFPPPYLVKKKLGGRQGRLIADLRTVEDHAVIVFLSIMIRGHHAYDREFGRDPIAYGQRHFAHLVSNDELARYVNDRTHKGPPPEKGHPSEAEYAFLFNAFSHQVESGAEDLVCETKEWVELVTQERVVMQLALVSDTCLNALSAQPGLHYAPVQKPGWGIWFLRSPGRLVLLTLCIGQNAAEAESIARRTAADLDGRDATTILRASRRAYPALILADSDLWLDLEREPLGNMALSPEESEVLESVRTSSTAFPLFVNGRAGSGKSTILQYIFADLLFFHLGNQQQLEMAPPIYLTANPELLRVARTFVERLLKTESSFAQLGGQDLAREHKPILDQAFREFRTYLLSLLAGDEKARHFGEGARVDYARFRRMWVERFGREPKAYRETGPDLSWHVIRSYVKGMGAATYLDPDDYEELPENQITVTQDSFERVFRRVWEGWYQQELESKALWDDQDLTRYILDCDLAQPVFPAVVCDESQDFTRLELELLLRVNLFSDRKLPPNAIRRVPFAFAGDPFQTLNPTGFRWDAIKASFVEKFVSELDSSRRAGGVELNYRELQYNYRSTRPIVRFGNHVQAIRAALFQMPDVKPQTPWTTERDSPPVMWFRSTDATFWKKFRENPGFVVIVPCGEGEEASFVEQDPNLREHVRMEDGVPVNVLSAARAKGCEYPAVVVYGFGQAADGDVVGRIASKDAGGVPEPDRHLPLQYFVNRVYVAVSRPKRRLVVVDTDGGFARLWKCAQDEVAQSTLMQHLKNARDVWEEQIEGMAMGRPDDLTRETVGDPLDNARAFETEGLARQDAFLLKQAALAYRSGGDAPKARECRARAFEAEGEWREAGEAYLEAGFVLPDGVRCLWRAGRDGWKRLCDVLADYPQIQHELEYQWARIATQRSGAGAVADLLDQFARRLDDPRFAGTCSGDPIWRDALSGVLGPYVEQEVRRDDVQWTRIASALDQIARAGVLVPAKVGGYVYYFAGSYQAAIDLWNKCGETKSTVYRRAKAAVTPYPEQVSFLDSLELWDEICHSYTARKNAALTEEQAILIVRALSRSGQLENAFELAWAKGLASSLVELAVDARRREHRQVASASLHGALAAFVRQGQWDVIGAFAETRTFQPSPEWKTKEVQAWLASEGEKIVATFVRALARSDALPSAPTPSARKVSEFLKRHLRVKEPRWRQDVSVAEAGAAFERAGRFTDSLSFYEALEGELGSPEVRRFARERWVVSKQRQLEHERAVGASVRTRDIEREISRALADLRLASVDQLPTYPHLTPMPSPLDEAGRTDGTAGAGGSVESRQGPAAEVATVVVGPFKLEVSRRNRRCNITHTDTMATAYVKCAEQECGGEVPFLRHDHRVWKCEPWSLVVHFPAETGAPLIIESGVLGVLLREDL